MKILGIVGSPRMYSNTAILVEESLRMVRPDIQTEIVYLRNLQIGHCQACGFKVCSQGCIVDDDMLELYDKVKECDGLIIGTPTYFCAPSSLIMAFMQRLIHLKGSTKSNLLKDKVGGVIAVGKHRGGGQTNAISCIHNMFHCCDMITISSEGLHLDSHLGGIGIGDCKKDTYSLESARQLGIRMKEVVKMIKK
jgi:multimeric flavodoxin WrbA